MNKYSLLKKILFILISIVALGACKQKNATPGTVAPTEFSESAAIAKVVALDTVFSKTLKINICREEIAKIDTTKNAEAQPYYHYFRGLLLSLDDHKDSAKAAYHSMQPRSEEAVNLKNYVELKSNLGMGASNAALVNEIQVAAQKAETNKSKFLYDFYDLLARVYYQNNNAKQSLYYTHLYYTNHPFRTHPVITQRYYDISFMQAYKMHDVKKMIYFNTRARALAVQLNDSMAISRTYDYEAQINVAKGLPEKSIEASRKYFQYLQKTHQLNEVVYNNLATSFLKNKSYDSAIYFYKKGIEFSNPKKDLTIKASLYSGLKEAYVEIGNYREALKAADSAAVLSVLNAKVIDEAKIAEVHEKFAAEKKDIRIEQLNNSNVLNQKVIVQQRWTLLFSALVFVGVLFTLFIFNRQRLLKNRNALLTAKNKRLQIEQKMLQSQLNPHFIFNSIANLQSLIGSGQRDLSMNYLSSFSKLLRNTLEQNRKSFIALEEEAAGLSNYLNLQQMRFPDLFDYEITIHPDINAETLLIPPMIVQPFLENSVEHGFRNIEYKGVLKINFSVEESSLKIIIDDNGCGLKENDEKIRHKKSLSRIIIKERMERIYKSTGQLAKFDIIDKNALGENGVKVEITLPAISDE